MKFCSLINFKMNFERKTFIFEHDCADRRDLCSSRFMIFAYACMPFSQNATGSPILCCVKKKISQGFIFDFVFHPSVIIYIICFHNLTRRSVDDSAECGCIHGAVALHGFLHAIGTSAPFRTAINEIFSCFFFIIDDEKNSKTCSLYCFSARPQSFPSTGINIFAVLPVEHRQGTAIGLPALHSINSARKNDENLAAEMNNHNLPNFFGLGQRFTLRHIRNGKELTEIVADHHLDYQYQEVHTPLSSVTTVFPVRFNFAELQNKAFYFRNHFSFKINY